MVRQSLAKSYWTEPPIRPLIPIGALVTQFCSLVSSVFFYICIYASDWLRTRFKDKNVELKQLYRGSQMEFL